jgi:ketosteroid isomerase-like protein
MHRITLSVLVAIAAVVALTGCAQHGHSHVEGDKAALEAKSAGWIESFNAGDGEGIAALHSLDAKLFPPNAPPVNGRADIATFWQGVIDSGLKAELQVDEIDASGTLGTRVGRFKIIGADGTVMDEGRFIEVWKYVNDEWHSHRDIWNSDLPLPEADEEATEEQE